MELKVRLNERVKNQMDIMAQESTARSNYCQTARSALLDLIEARWSKISPPSAMEVESWIAMGRRGEK